MSNMKSLNEIAYAENEREMIKVVDVCALPDHMLHVKFSDGEIKEVNFKIYLEGSAFAPLKDEEVFKSVYVERGIPMWCDGTIDIAPERLYEDGIPIDNVE